MRAVAQILLGPLVTMGLFGASVAESRPMTVDDLMRVRNIAEARLSPDGDRVVYALQVADLEASEWSSGLWLVGWSGGEPRRLTRPDDWNDTPRWSPDGRRLAFLSDRDGTNQVYLLDPDGGEAAPLGHFPRGATGIAWAPDGSTLAVLTPAPESEIARTRREEKRDVAIEGEGFFRQELHLLEVDIGESRALLADSTASVVTCEWSPRGDRLAVTLQTLAGAIGFFRGTEVGVIDVETGEVTRVVDRPGLDTNPRWSPDGRHLAFLSHGGVEDWIGACNVNVVEIANSAPPRNLTAMFNERDYGAEYLWAPDGSALLVVEPQGVNRILFRIPLDGGEPRPLTGEMQTVGGMSLASQRPNRRVLLISRPDLPTEVFAMEGGDAPPRRLTFTNPHLDEVDFGRAEIVKWRSTDGLAVEGLFIHPVKGTKLPAPMITIIHGGPSTPMMAAFGPQTGAGGFPQMEHPDHVYAGRGYGVFLPNFRGSGGYGREFLLANVGDWGGADLEDVLAGLDHLVERGIADPERLGIGGWSYGGTLTAVAVTRSHRFRAASVGAGITNHLSAYGTMDIPPLLESYMAGPPWEAFDTYRRSSAVSGVQEVSTPTLLLYGENDSRVPAAQGREFYRGLQARNVPSQLVIYPRSGHAIFEPRLQMDFHRRNLDWFARWFASS